MTMEEHGGQMVVEPRCRKFPGFVEVGGDSRRR